MCECSNVCEVQNTARCTLSLEGINKIYVSNTTTLNVVKNYYKYYRCSSKFCKRTYESFNCNRFYEIS